MMVEPDVKGKVSAAGRRCRGKAHRCARSPGGREAEDCYPKRLFFSAAELGITLRTAKRMAAAGRFR